MQEIKRALPLTFVPFENSLYRSSIRGFFDICIGDERSFFKAIDGETFAIFTPPEVKDDDYEFSPGLYISIYNSDISDVTGNNVSSFTFPNVTTIEEAEILIKAFNSLDTKTDSTGGIIYSPINLVEKVKRLGGRIEEYYEFINRYATKNNRVSLVKLTTGEYNGRPEKITYIVTIEKKEVFSNGSEYFTENREDGFYTEDLEEAKNGFKESVLKVILKD